MLMRLFGYQITVDQCIYKSLQMRLSVALMPAGLIYTNSWRQKVTMLDFHVVICN